MKIIAEICKAPVNFMKMKKLLYIFLVTLSAIVVTSCKKDNTTPKKIEVPAAVDIGLVVDGKHIKWASFNVGATKPWEYGNYYSWGELEPKGRYSESDYSYVLDPENPVLLPDDDVAHVKLGGGWRLPTAKEFKALLDLKDDPEHYEWSPWVVAKDEKGDWAYDQFQNVIHGIRIMERLTGKSIFLPAGGQCSDSAIGDFAGDRGYYWTSTVRTDVETYPAKFVLFDPEGAGIGDYKRYLGRLIRPVTEE